MTTLASPVNGQQVRYDNIQYYTTKEGALFEIGKRNMQLCMHPQFVGAEGRWVIEGHYKSDPYGNPYILRDDGVFRKLHTDKPATR